MQTLTKQNLSDIQLELGTSPYREVNEQIRNCIDDGIKHFQLNNVLGQRYLACAASSDISFEIHGIPGNDLGAYMNGASIEVFGNAQDQVGNTMNDGDIVVHGRCGDAAGYGMRGGSIYIEGDCGWRVGIHMKRYKDKNPIIFVGGDAGAFLGEYMAGGRIVLIGKPGQYLATGMHGGIIYLKDPVEDYQVSWSLVQEKVTEDDLPELEAALKRYEDLFGHGCNKDASEFYKLRPRSKRPYGNVYA